MLVIMFMFILAQLPDAQDKMLKVKITTVGKPGGNQVDQHELTKLMQQLLYLKTLYENNKLEDPEVRKELELALAYDERNIVVRVAEGCCELSVFSPTQHGRDKLFANQDKIQCIMEMILKQYFPNTCSEVTAEVTKHIEKDMGKYIV
eukprot:GHVT01098013.1.p1 GENE.GHVT01098013.1~~GHVT01098013.1.p1  ORF type:complete len:148 (+),score=0.87 GHVT01098013.1:97-540(+)